MHSKFNFALLTLALISSFAFSIPGRASAQPSPDSVSVVVANINLSNAAILSQDGGVFRISVDFVNNGDTSQSDIKYGVELVKKQDKIQTKVDTFVSDETLTIDTKKTLHKEFTYTASPLLEGRYELWLLSRTTGGLTLGIARVGEVSLATTAGGRVEIVPESCYLQVGGDAKKYSLPQGVDVSKEETLSILCSAKNNFPHSVTVSPSFETHERTVYGPVVDVIYPETPSITFKPGETKELSFIIQKPGKPQAYDATLTLVDSSSRTAVSGSVVAHYVLRGASATIQNASLDKAIYKKGDLITTTLFWSPSADSFPDSRSGTGTDTGDITIQVDIVDESGVPCADTITKVVTGQEMNTSLTANASNTCVSPRATLTLADKGGKILDSRTFSSPTGSGSPARELPVNMMAVLAILLGASTAFFIWKRYLNLQGVARTLLLLVVASSAFFAGAGEAEALTYGTGGVITTVNTNKSVYSPGETIVLSGEVSFAGCGNSFSDVTVLAALNPQLIVISSPGSYYLSGSLIAPSSPGTYSIDASSFSLLIVSTFSDWSWGSIPITVSVAPSATFSASPTSISYNTASTLTWSSTNATSCTAGGAWSGAKATSGSASTGNLTSSQTYTLYCTGPGGNSSTESATVTVSSPPPTATLSASPTSIFYNTASTLTWSSTNATSCIADGAWSGAKATSGSASTGNLTSSQTYTLYCTGPGGNSSTQSATVTVAPAPTATLSGSNCTIASGGASCAAPFTWAISNATTPNLFNSTTGIQYTTAASGTGVSYAITKGNNTVQARNGTTVLRSTPVTATCASGTVWDGSVCAPTNPPTVSISASPGRVGVGGSSTISWSSNHVTSCTVTKNGAFFSSAHTSAGVLDTGITAQTEYKMDCEGNDGSVGNTATVLVNVTPGFNEF